MDKLSVIRCMTQPVPGVANSHPMGAQYIYSGETPGGAVEMPDMSSVIAMRPRCTLPLQSDAHVTPFGVNRRNLTGLQAGHTVVIISISHCEIEFYE